MRALRSRRVLPGVAVAPEHPATPVLALATAVGSTGLAAGGTAGALLAVEITGTSASAGLPTGALVAGAAAGALLASYRAARGQRGQGLVLAYLLGVAGAVTVLAAASARSLPALLAGSTVLGAANSAVFLTRYAAAGPSGTAHRGRALGLVFGAATIGAVTGPLLLGPTGALAAAVGLPRLGGLYLVAIVAFGLAAALLAAATDPRAPWLGRAAPVLARGRRAGAGPGPRGALRMLSGPAGPAVAVLAVTNFVMVAVMTIAPVGMLRHGASLPGLGVVVAVHVAGMFAFAPVSGILIDRYGPVAVGSAGGALLAVACLLGTVTSGHGSVAMAVHLVAVGVGWNCGVVAGSAQLAAAAPESLRPHVEAVGEVAMSAAAAVAAPVAGLIAAGGGYRALAFAGAATALLVPIAARGSHPKRKFFTEVPHEAARL